MARRRRASKRPDDGGDIMRSWFISLAVTAALFSLQAGPAAAHGKPKNLKVIQAKKIKKGMKTLNKAFGVKCTACHIKKEWDKDDVEAKDLSRKYLKLALSKAPKADQQVALKALLKAIKKDKVKRPKRLEQVLGLFELKPLG